MHHIRAEAQILRAADNSYVEPFCRISASHRCRYQNPVCGIRLSAHNLGNEARHSACFLHSLYYVKNLQPTPRHQAPNNLRDPRHSSITNAHTTDITATISQSATIVYAVNGGEHNLANRYPTPAANMGCTK
jgi:hypothetical protein